MKNLLCLLFLIILVSSCANLRSVSQTSIPSKKGKKVKAEVTNNVVFFFNFNNNHVDLLARKLAEKCPEGSVEGVLTKDVVVTYFPVIFHKEHITAEGYCND